MARTHGSKLDSRYEMIADPRAELEALRAELSALRQTEKEHARAEEALRLSEERFRGLLEYAADGFFLVDREGKIVDVNQRACDALGYERDELIGMSVNDFATPADGEGDASGIFAQLTPGVSYTREGFHRRRDGTTFPVEVRIGKFPGERELLVAIARDTTERAEAEAALRESEQRFAAVLGSAMDAILIADSRSRITLFNEAAERTFGCTADQAIGQALDNFLGPAFRALVAGCTRELEDDDEGKRYLWVPEGLSAVRADGSEFPVEATISWIQVGDHELCTIILRDVNERKRAEAALRRMQREKVYLQEVLSDLQSFEDMVGSSAAIKHVFEDVEKVAATDSSVLITGETGTGKELIARAIHNGSRRKDKVLIKVNCATLPAGLIESELFGHEKGAFTGAHARKIGRFELADGGTIFLDEIGDLPLDLQTKLLRVLQEGEFERVGGSRTLKVDVRVIAATNRDLAKAIEEENFRSDLYYRLSVFPIRMPALRERKEDIPLLVRHFVMKYATKLGKKIDSIPKDALQSLQAYDWPGNVRELENVIERAVILTHCSELELGSWLPEPGGTAREFRIPTLEELEREHITSVLELTGGRVRGEKGAAKILGLKPTTLEARMKKLGIQKANSPSNMS